MNPVISLDPGAAALLDSLRQAGYSAYAVGGCVRDSLLGKTPDDWDLCTSALPQQMLDLFGAWRCIPTGLQHGTLTVREGEGLYEVTTFRVEGSYSDGRHPDRVDFVTDVRQDLARRDFTINAMAYHPAEGLIDPFGGLEDLKARQVRAVGDPAQRFREDALRILRFYRFGAREEFSLHPATRQAALALREGLREISAERIFQELSKLLLAPRPGRWMEPALFAVILPGLDPLGQPQRFSASCAALDRAPADLTVRLALLLAPLSEPQAAQALRQLRAPGRTLRQVVQLLAEQSLIPAAEPDARRLQARQLLARLDPDQALRLTALGQALRPGPLWAPLEETLRQLTDQGACCRIGQLAVNGRDLEALGFAPGPALGRALNQLLDQVIREQLPNQRVPLLAAAQTLLTQNERQDTP